MIICRKISNDWMVVDLQNDQIAVYVKNYCCKIDMQEWYQTVQNLEYSEFRNIVTEFNVKVQENVIEFYNIIDQVYVLIGQFTMQPDCDSTLIGLLCNYCLELQQQTIKVQKLEQLNNKLIKQNEDILELKERAELESFSKFKKVLNSKKHKIRQLMGASNLN